MPYLLIDHAVEDYDAWKPHFDDHGTTREEGGCLGGELFHEAGDPDRLVILFEWDSLENAHEFAASEDLEDTMAEAGVLGEPDLQFLAKVEDVPV